MDYYEMLEAVNKFFSDRSRPAEETRDGLIDLQDEINVLLECLDTDKDG